MGHVSGSCSHIRMTPTLRLVAQGAPRTLPPLDAVQRSVVEHPRDRGHVLVVGAPGSGKTTTAMSLLERRIESAESSERVLMLVPSRRAAARIRDEVTARLGRTVGQVAVRTPASLAYAILRARASLLGQPSPTLITGPEQDAMLADLLAGHREGEGAAPRWPEHIPDAVLAMRAFRDELRDLLMRAAQAGLSPAGLASLGRRRGRGEWVAAAAVQREYEQVLRLGQSTPDRGERYDAAVIVDEAVAALRSWSQSVPGSDPPRFDTVVVDDHQETTLAAARLLHALADDGAQVFLFGDADTGVQGFRGASASLVAAATAGPEQSGGFSATRVVLPTVWRHGPRLRAVAAAVTGRIAATGGVRHRRAPSAWAEPGAAESEPGPGRADPGEEPGGPGPSGVEVALARTRAQEAALIARLLREERLHHGTRYADMAVVLRGGAQARSMRRRLAAAGVPVSAVGASALRDSPAVGPLLLALEAALGGRLTADAAIALVMSPLAGSGRLDSVSLRALRRLARSTDVGSQAGPRAGADPDEPIVSLIDEPARCRGMPARLAEGPERISAVLTAAAAEAARPGATAETVLWAAWSAAGLAEVWRRTALAGGASGDRADEDLDAVLELFRAAEQFTQRNPAARPAEFLRYLEGQHLPSDSLAARGGKDDAVQVVTAAGAAGRQWAVVAVAGVQDDVWPDLRVRGSLLGGAELTEIAAGRSQDRAGSGREPDSEARREVLQDELRAFAVAVSRARRRLVVTAVRDSELAPSPFLDIVDPQGAQGDSGRAFADAAVSLDLRGLVATLRHELPGGEDAAAAAELLADLARLGIPGADPQEWSAARSESTQAPLWEPDETVELSPSALETAQACPLRWALQRVGGRGAPGTEQSLGTLVHAIAAEHPHGSHADLAAELERRWPELGLGDGWVGRRQRAVADLMIRRLADYLASRPGRVEVERAIEVLVGRALLKGRVDRIEYGSDGAVTIVDLKTGASTKSREQVKSDPQLGAYQEAVRLGALGDDLRPGGAALVYVGCGARATQRQQAALKDDWVETMVRDVTETVAASSFAATAGEACRSCPVRTSCPAQAEGARVCT